MTLRSRLCAAVLSFVLWHDRSKLALRQPAGKRATGIEALDANARALHGTDTLYGQGGHDRLDGGTGSWVNAQLNGEDLDLSSPGNLDLGGGTHALLIGDETLVLNDVERLQW